MLIDQLIFSCLKRNTVPGKYPKSNKFWLKPLTEMIISCHGFKAMVIQIRE